MIYKNKYYQNCDRRRDKFTKIRQSIIGDENCYCKEKRGRYDITYYWDTPGAQDRLLEEVENESEKCCQYCGRHLPQVWIDYWWVIHLCWWHALCWMCLCLYHHFKTVWKI